MYHVVNLFSLLMNAIYRVWPGSVPALAQALAFLSYKVMGVRRSLIRENLTRAFGAEKSAEEIDRIGYASVRNFTLCLIEFFAIRDGSLSDCVTIVGKENIEALAAAKRGIYVMCFHMGSWEAMGGAFTKQLINAHVVVKKVGSAGVNRFVLERRAVNRFLSIERQKKGDGIRAIADIIARGEAVGFVFDQARPGNPRLPFFGEPAKTNTSFAHIWSQYPAPIVVSYIIRNPDGKSHTLFVEPPLVLEPGGTDISYSTYFNTIVERIVRAHPEHYFWMHNRWK